MFLLGHLGIALGLAWFLAGRRSAAIDFRLVLLGAILPDLIDKPLGAVLGLESRLWAHTLLFLGVVLALSFVPRLASFRLIGFGVAAHLLLDQIWQRSYIVWYPAYGWTFPSGVFDPEFWLDTLLHDPYVQAGEIIGLAVLVGFAWAHGLRSWSAIRGFLTKGILRGTT